MKRQGKTTPRRKNNGPERVSTPMQEAPMNQAELLRITMDSVPDHIYVKDTESRFVVANASLARHMGAETPEQLVGKTDFDFYPEELAAQFYAVEQAILESGRAQINREEPGVDRAGNRMWFLSTKVPLRDSSGRIVGIAGSSRDVTEQKWAEEALRNSEALYHSLVEGLPLSVFRKDLEGRFTFGNRLFCETLSRPLEEIVGKSDFDFFPKELAEKYRADDRRVIETREVFEDVEEHQKPDGERIYVQVLKAPVYDFRGQVVGMQGSFWDVTERKRAEEALRNSETLYQSLVECLPLNVFRKDLEGRFTFGNRLFCETLGRPLKGIIGKTDFDFFPKELAEKYRGDDRRVIETREVFEDIEEHQKPDGERIYVQVLKTPVYDFKGEPVGMQGIFWDVTQRKRAEEALRDSEALYHSLVESLPLNVFRKDLEGRFTFGNGVFCKTLGRSPEELLGKTDFDFFPEELAEKYRDDDRRVVQTGEVFEDIEEHQKPDGERIYVEVLKTPVRDAKGETVGMQGIFWDVTEKKRAEAALARERNLLRTLIDTSPDPIYVKDTQSRFVIGNIAVARLMGAKTPDDLIGKTDFDFYPKELASRYYADERKVTESGQRLISYEEPFIDTKGNQGWVSSSKVPFRNSDGEVVGLVGIGRDITEQKRAEEELKKTAEELARSNAELEQFAYVASHDLQEPLRMVASYTQLLTKRYRDQLDSDADDFIEYIVDGASRMQVLIDDLLTYSRVGTHGKPFQRTDCEAVFGRVFANLQMAIHETGAIVTHDHLPVVQADPSQLGQLFQNLMSNAIKFHGKETPRVHVSAEENGHEWLFSVRDNGIGIAPEYAERIFVIFQRLHGLSDYPGTGIGLAVCKKIVQRHGGRIWVESQPGKGSTFHFTIPKAGDQ